MFVEKFWLIMLSFFLYFTNPFRDLSFYYSIAAHEGFDSTGDTFIIGFVEQIIVTIYYSPLALLFLTVGFGFAKRIAFFPSFRNANFVWSVLLTIAALPIGGIEISNLLYMITRPQHWKAFIFSLLYFFIILAWWSSGLTIFSNPQIEGSSKNRADQEIPKERNYEKEDI